MATDSSPHLPVDTTQPATSQSDNNSNWLYSAASEAWTMASGGTRVVKDLAVGFVQQAYEHPGQTLAEIGGGVVAAGVIAEAGVGAVGTAAIAALPLAAYGIYRGAQIASTEGLSAIPQHMQKSYEQARDFGGNASSAIASDFSGSSSGADAQSSAQKVQDLGADMVPLAAGAIGGGLGGTAAKFTGSILRDFAESTLPVLTLEPAYVNPIPSVIGATTATGAGLEAAATGATVAGSGATILQRTEEGHPEISTTGSARLDDYTRQQLFVEGRVATGAQSAEERSLAGSLTQIFQDPEKILAQGGRIGNVELTRTSDGWLEAQITGGPMKDTIALYKPGDSSFIVERSSSAGQAHVIQMPGR